MTIKICSCENCTKKFETTRYDFALCDSCRDQFPKCIYCWNIAIDQHSDECDRCYFMIKKANSFNILQEYQENLFEKSNLAGFDLRCKTCNYHCNEGDDKKKHLLFDHEISQYFDRWESFFRTFTVGDSYTCSYRCKVCRWEFLLEKDAKSHLWQIHKIYCANNLRT